MSALKKIWNIFTTVLVAAVVFLAIALAGVRLVGLRPMAVLSGSMEPTYHTGSLIYVKSVDYRDLKVGDPITFMLDEDTIATHRIVEIVPDEEDPAVLRYRTKGDANESEDGGLVHYKNVVGSPIFTIPKLGYLANYIQHPPGTYIAISVGAIALLLMFLPELLSSFFEEEEEPKPKKEKAPKKEKTAKKARPEPEAEAEPPVKVRFEPEPEAEEPGQLRFDDLKLSPEATRSARHERPAPEKKPVRAKKQKYVPKH